MKVELESTTKLVTLVVNGVEVRARVWEGMTAKGIRCHAFIPRIAVANGDDASEFEADLKDMQPPSNEVAAIPLRMIL